MSQQSAALPPRNPAPIFLFVMPKRKTAAGAVKQKRALAGKRLRCRRLRQIREWSEPVRRRHKLHIPRPALSDRFRPFRCVSSPHRNRLAGFRRGPQWQPPAGCAEPWHSQICSAASGWHRQYSGCLPNGFHITVPSSRRGSLCQQQKVRFLRLRPCAGGFFAAFTPRNAGSASAPRLFRPPAPPPAEPRTAPA